MDNDDKGIKCGRILYTKTLGYTDFIVLVEETVDGMSKRLTSISIADGSWSESVRHED